MLIIKQPSLKYLVVTCEYESDIEKKNIRELNKLSFFSRILGTTTLSAITYLAYKSRSAPLPPPARAAMLSLLGMGWMQVNL